MKPKSFMLIAGEASGDLLAAELVRALKSAFARQPGRPSPDAQPVATDLAPQFFGAGGPQLAAAGVELAFDLTRHSVIGLPDAIKKYRQFKRLFDRLFELACEREPDVIICVDFSGFNRRFAHAVKQYVRSRRGWFHNWNPKLVQYVSPQVWASRPGRAMQLAEDVDLLLSIIPFEMAWYAGRVPKLRVEFVGNPIVDRYPRTEGRGREKCGVRSAKREVRSRKGEGSDTEAAGMIEPPPAILHSPSSPLVLLLPGSRAGELGRHLPLVIGAAKRIAATTPVRFRMILPNEASVHLVEAFRDQVPQLEVCVAGLADSLAEAELAITKSGTITLECAYFGLPAVVFYKASWPSYVIGRLAVKTKYLAMPNLLADEPVYPEFIQHAATPENIAQAALGLLHDAARRAAVRAKLTEVIRSLGGPGASGRAAEVIWALFDEPLRLHTR
ncbi:MAG: lipid-A-disaccharide synthase [Limisphaerales bacterium]